MVSNIQTIVNGILKDPKPVLIFDTCSLLDIVRSGCRDNISSENISAAFELSQLKDKWLLASEVVAVEWRDNIDSAEQEVRNNIRNTHKNSLVFKEALDHSPSINKWTYVDILSFNLEKCLKTVSNDLLNSIELIENDQNCVGRASYRSINSLPPASKGKGEFKDCLIFEKCIEIGNQLKAKKFTNTVIFISSNKSDFGSPFDQHNTLNLEFLSANVIYVADIKTALNMSK